MVLYLRKIQQRSDLYHQRKNMTNDKTKIDSRNYRLQNKVWKNSLKTIICLT